MIDVEKCPKSYLGLAMIATFIFFSPLGFIAIYNGAFVKKYWDYGDLDKAMEKSKKARIWSWIAIITSMIVIITIIQLIEN